ncbi:hypothetical protein PINS_up006877 [Pythium insidiosum]|nr:hypothetical protein PINS_up006877 [Pythium insidiosum]
MKTRLLSSFLAGCGVLAAATATAAAEFRVTHSGFQSLPTPSPLLQIRSDGQKLCGVTTEHRATCASFSAASSSELSWQTLDKDGVVAVAVANSTVWIVNDLNGVNSSVLTADGKNGPWKSVNARVVDIVTEGTVLGAIGTNGYQFYLPVEFSTSKEWRWNPIWEKSRTIDTVYDGKAVSVLANGSTWFIPQNLFPASNGPFQSISSDGTFACATKDTTETVYCVTKNMTAWQPVGGRLSQISVRSGRLFGVGSNGTLWTTTLKLSSIPDVSNKTLDDQEKEADGTFVGIRYEAYR